MPLQLSRALVKRGHEIDIYTSSLRLDSAALAAEGINIRAFKTWGQIASFDITPGMVKISREAIMKKDIIHLHNYRTFQNIIAHHYAKKHNIPYVLQAHGSLTTYFQKGRLKKLFDAVWGRQILKDAAKVFAVTAAEAAQYRSLGVNNGRIEIVPHGIDLAEYDNTLPKGAFKQKYNLRDDQKIILYLGRLHKMKGLDILAAAFANLGRSEATLVIAGPDDGYLPALKKQLAESGMAGKVVFTGPLYGREKLLAYHDCDIYVLPSSYEIFGITVLEAWGCGKPVIVTDRCGLADVVKERAGLVVSYDPAALANAISAMLDSPSIRQEFGAEGRKLVEEQYNWPRIASRIESIYGGIIAGHKKQIAIKSR